MVCEVVCRVVGFIFVSVWCCLLRAGLLCLLYALVILGLGVIFLGT